MGTVTHAGFRGASLREMHEYAQPHPARSLIQRAAQRRYPVPLPGAVTRRALGMSAAAARPAIGRRRGPHRDLAFAVQQQLGPCHRLEIVGEVGQRLQPDHTCACAVRDGARGHLALLAHTPRDGPPQVVLDRAEDEPPGSLQVEREHHRHPHRAPRGVEDAGGLDVAQRCLHMCMHVIHA